MNELDREAELISLSFENMLVQWGSNTPPRNGLHASSLLVKEEEWCVRRFVLAELYPDEAVSPAVNHWDWKREAIFANGWSLHERWQQLFRHFGKVVYKVFPGEDGKDDPEPELDLTHYDSDRNIYFSPDAILEFGPNRYVVEIKGIKQESYEKLTDDLDTACKACETVAKAKIQANLYMHLLGLKKAILLIENKNNQSFKIWVTEYDKNMAMEPVHRALQVKGALTLINAGKQSNRATHRICASLGDTQAKQCPMAKCCFRLNWEKESEVSA